ncbi:MAG: hypothetical protein K8I30_07220, partial [Anaerolineae bacterium]|nr:hypothetical protein [Anaerolineae bacterium]
MANEIAYGFHKLEDIFDEKVTAQEPEVMDEAVMMSAQRYSEDLDAMLTTLTGEIQGYPKKRVQIGIGGELQPLSENGTPIPIRIGARYEQGFPLARGGDSLGWNRESFAAMTVREMNRRTIEVEKRDAAWNIRRLLAALFTNTSWTYADDDDDIGNLTIKGLASGDTDTYLDLNGAYATDNHYSAQANAISSTDNPFPTLYEELYEHPTNSGPFIALIPQDLTTSVMALPSFNYNPNLSPFVQYGQDVTLASEMVEEYLGFGNRVLGEVDQFIAVEARRMPSSYIVAYAAGNEAPVVGLREPNELAGLQSTMVMVDSNFRKWDFYRRRGYAVWDRTGAAVRRIG